HIIQNAAQAIAAANNAGTIWIVTSRLCDPIGKTEKIQIKIEDDGAGMSEEAVKRAFVPFFTTKEVGSGKGLGLSMVDGIIQRQGGTVALESTEGKGTSVTITLALLQNEMFYR
ncbi:MAG: ATP-binding protein, partial [Nitrospirae bacterium]|nr:ATP-binding protein [Nitrospirota bacterium]